MPLEECNINENSELFKIAKEHLLELKLSYIHYENASNQKRTDLIENELRQIFSTLNSNDRMLILYEAIMSNAAGIADNYRKLDFYEKAEHIGFMNWFKKVMIAAFAFTGVITFSMFMFAIVKNGAFNDLSFLASFLKTINEFLNVIFLTK